MKTIGDTWVNNCFTLIGRMVLPGGRKYENECESNANVNANVNLIVLYHINLTSYCWEIG